jgi:hypothetical protein
MRVKENQGVNGSMENESYDIYLFKDTDNPNSLGYELTP